MAPCCKNHQYARGAGHRDCPNGSKRANPGIAGNHEFLLHERHYQRRPRRAVPISGYGLRVTGAFRGNGKRGRRQLVPHRISARGSRATAAAEPSPAAGADKEEGPMTTARERSPELQFPIPTVLGGVAGGTPWAGTSPRLPRRQMGLRSAAFV
ncbi:hypothetical protein CYMTET_29599 [Cymbomonas tetramitiformis]|uniref:Uncharacterized protein n=1 Tax=Cymbomonas tetramitiformis TaxID=36881 RepID=A0AAE0FKQ6_9CHLO|nr:hypothetical protein CYMTET_29599 [Cymbomonas tetramitiformis]